MKVQWMHLQKEDLRLVRISRNVNLTTYVTQAYH